MISTTPPPALAAQPRHLNGRYPAGPGPASDWALDLAGVSKVFHKSPGLRARFHRNGHKPERKRIVAVDDVSFAIERGEIFGLLGPNGTGKSTLIRLVSTLLLPDTGTIRVFGYDVERDETAVKRLINRVSVDASFFKKLTPMENLMYAARLYRVDAALARRSIVDILHRLGIEDRSISAPVEDMSRGMQQKVAIARAFLTAPVLLLLDEPTTGLDPHSKRAVQAFVRDIRAEHDTTVLLTTHDMVEADTLCDRIAIVDRGRIVALDTPSGLKALIGRHDGDVSLEDVFLEVTGRELKNDQETEGAE